MKMKAKTLLSLLLGLSLSVENLTKAQDVLPVPTGAGSTGATTTGTTTTTDHRDMVALADGSEDTLLRDPDSDADAIYDTDLEQGQGQAQGPHELDAAKATLSDEQELGTASTAAASSTGTNPDATLTLGLKKDINPDMESQVHDDDQTFNRTKQDQTQHWNMMHAKNDHVAKVASEKAPSILSTTTDRKMPPNSMERDQIVMMDDTKTDSYSVPPMQSKEDTDPKIPRHVDVETNTEAVEPSVADQQEQDDQHKGEDLHVYGPINKTDVGSRLEAMQLMASTDKDKQVDADSAKEDGVGEVDNDQADTKAVSVHRHGRRLDHTTDWLMANTRMYGRRETANLAVGWTAAQNFCKEQGGSLASIREICPPDGTTNRRPLFGIQAGGDQWAPISDRENQWVNVGSGGGHPTCTLHGGAAPELTGQGHHHGWGNYIVCNNWYKFGGSTQVRDIGAAEDGTLWAIGTHDHGNGCYSIHRNTGGDSWVEVGGCSHRISVGSSAYIVILNYAGQIHAWTPNGWVFIHSPPARDISITNDGTIWMTELVAGLNHGDVLRKRPSDSSFVRFGGGGDRISASGSNKAALCNADFLWSHGGSHWYTTGRCDNGDVSIAADGTIWTTGTPHGQANPGLIRKSTKILSHSTSWATPIPGQTGTNIAAVSANKVYLVDANLNLWRYEIPARREATGITRVFVPPDTNDVKSYDQAQDFCESQGGSLASVADICPLDGSAQPYFGIQSGDHWAPASDYHNAWVQVGVHSSASTCASHRDSHNGVDPDWGLDGTMKQSYESNYIVCNMRTAIYGPSYTTNVKSYDQANAFCNAKGGTLASRSDICPLNSVVPYFGTQLGDQWTPVADYNNSWIQVGEQPSGVPTCSYHRETHGGVDPNWGVDGNHKQPFEANFVICASNRVLFGRNKNVTVSTYDLAQAFCKAKGGSLASSIDVCPSGAHSLPYFGIPVGDQWTPVSDRHNEWIQVGTQPDGLPTCGTYSNPGWGLTGSWAPAANYLVCSSRWLKFNGLKVRDVGAADDGTIWVIGTHDHGNGCYSIYRHTGGDSWVEVGGCSHRISVGSRDHIVILNYAGQIHGWTPNGWVLIQSPPARDISITKEGIMFLTELVSGQVWGLIYRKAPTDDDFALLGFGGGGERISASGRDRVTLCNTLAGNHLWSNDGSHWYTTGTCDNGDISVAADGTIWTTGTPHGQSSPGLAHRSISMNVSATTWDTPAQGRSGKDIAAVNANKFLLVDSSNSLWLYEIPSSDVDFTTSRPTPAPTVSPAPSSSPSSTPSISPSSSPSSLPSGVPSISPSVVPSFDPSESPSYVPSMQPSDRPSQVPSLSSVPSSQPSSYPSTLPSSSPSLIPSGVPSENPTIAPTYAAFASTVEQRWQSEWGSIKMFGPHKTKPLDGGWNSAEDFCNSNGGTLASLAQICPPWKSNAEPVNGIQSAKGDQWAPIGDREGQWVNVGSSNQYPVCTKHGGSAGHGHALGWGNYVYCAPSNWYKFSGIKVKDVEQTIRDVDAAEDDTIWVISNYKVMTDCYSIHRYVGGDTWEEVRGCANGISVGSRTNIIVTTTDGEIHQWTGHGWKLIKSPPARDASITKDGIIFMAQLVSGQVWGLIYRKAPTDDEFVLLGFGGGGERISASGRDRVALCNTLAGNRLWSNGGSHWYQTGSCDNGDISITADGTIWTTGTPHGQSSPGLPRRSISMSASATTWDKPVQGKSGTKIAGVHADMFVMVDTAGTLWQYKVPIMPSQAGNNPLFGPSQTSNVKTFEQAKEFCQSKGGSLAFSTDICPTIDNWSKHNIKARDVGAADDGTIWVIGTHDHGNGCYSIHRHTGGDSWEEIGGCSHKISVGSKDHIVILNRHRQIHGWTPNGWVHIQSPPAWDVSITKDGTIWMTEFVSEQDFGRIYRKAPVDADFVEFGGGGQRISGLNAGKAVLCNTLAGNDLWSHGGAHWYSTGRCDKGDVSVASDGTIWTTGVGTGQTRPGLPRRSTAFTAHHTSWSPPVQGHSGVIIDDGGNIAAVSAREFLLIDSNLNLWHYEADKPYFGIQSSDQWTPVSDYENAWIQVGTQPGGAPACSFHRDTHNGVDPDWGIKGDKKSWESNYILCNMDKFIFGPEDTSKVIDYDDAKHFCYLKGGILASFDEICPLPLVKRPYFGAAGGVHWTPFGDYRNGWVEVGGDAVADMCSRHRTTYGDPRIGLGPMWGAEDDKLEGEADYVICKMEGVYVYGPNVTADVKSYAQAKTFCAARQLLLASWSDVCPPDGSNKPYFDIQTGDQWTPVSDYDNAWVQVGTHSNNAPSCSFHRDIHGGVDPIWGTSNDKKAFESNYIVCTSWFHKHREATSTDVTVAKAVFERREKINKLFSIPDHHLHGRISRSIARYKYPDGKQRNLCAYSEDGYNFPYKLAYYKMYPEEGSLEVKYTTNLEEMYASDDLRIMRPKPGSGYFSIGDIIWDGKVSTTENGTSVLVHHKQALLVKGSGSALKKPLYYQNIFNASIGAEKQAEGVGLSSGGTSETNTDLMSGNGTVNTGEVATQKPILWHEYKGVTVRDVGAAYDGTIWVISNFTVMNDCYTIHRKLEGDTWEEVRGCASGISVGSSTNVIVVQDSDIFKWSGQGWDLIPSPAARDATITKDGTIFLTELVDGLDHGDVWRKRPSDDFFVKFGGGGDRIAASGPDKAALCNKDFLWSHGGSHWYVTGSCDNGDISIAADGTIWTTGVGDGQKGRESAGLARRSTISTAIATKWADPIQGHYGVKIAAMSAVEFALVDSDNKLWRYENPGLRIPKTGNTQVFGPQETGAINSYDQAQKFCEMKGGTLASSTDICPSGSSSWPYFGIQDGDQWVPVSDYHNGWIQVGSHPVVSTCSLYRDTYGDPDWGLDGNGKKAWEANYIPCNMKIFVYGPTETAGVKSYDQARDFCVAKGGSLPASSDICPSDGSELWRKEWGDIHMFGPSETSSLAIGWSAAQDFCNSRGGTLASVKDICPPDGATNSTPVTGIQSTSADQWAPISERENQWVNVGSGGRFPVCTFHGGAAPEITGQGRHHGWGNYVFCSPHPKGWYKYRGVSVRDVGAAEDGTIWAIGTHDYIPGKGCYSIHRHTGGDSWEEVGGCSHRISVGSSTNIIVLNFHGHIHQWTPRGWVFVESPPARDISITRDGTIWLTEIGVGQPWGLVDRKLPNDVAFRGYLGGGGDRIAAAGPDVVAVCTTGAGDLLWVNGGSHYYIAGSCNNGDISFAADGTIWTTGVGSGQTSPGLPRRSLTSTSTATAWEAPVQGRSGRNIAAVSENKFLMVDASNRLWHYEIPTKIEPKLGALSGGSHFVPFDDYHNGWIEIGSDNQSPVCTKKADVTSEPNYIVCDLNRVVFGRSESAGVKTYNQAQQFCKAKGGYLASSAEICPSAGSLKQNWKKYGGMKATDVGAADDGTIWAIGTHDHGNGCYSIFRLTGGDSWVGVGGCSHRISVGSKDHIVILNYAGQIHQWTPNGWVFMHSPPARDISITKDGTIWMTELVAGLDHGDMWRKRPSDGSFVRFGGGGDRISALVGNKVVLCNKDSIWAHGDAGWKATGGDISCNGGDISVAADGTVWTTGVDKNHTGPGLAIRSTAFTADISWAQPVQGQSGVNIAAVNSREFLLVDSTNNLWHYFEADEPYFGVQSGDQWTPVSDDINAWVQVGVQPYGLSLTCQRVIEYFGHAPGWGVSGLWDGANYIVCNTRMDVYGPSETSNIKSYDQAKQFCVAKGGSLASSSDICPLGASEDPYFGKQIGDQWTPVMDYHNAWIQVGKHPWQAPTCALHRDTHGGVDPNWGVDGNMKQSYESNYVVCKSGGAPPSKLVVAPDNKFHMFPEHLPDSSKGCVAFKTKAKMNQSFGLSSRADPVQDPTLDWLWVELGTRSGANSWFITNGNFLNVIVHNDTSSANYKPSFLDGTLKDFWVCSLAKSGGLLFEMGTGRDPSNTTSKFINVSLPDTTPGERPFFGFKSYNTEELYSDIEVIDLNAAPAPAPAPKIAARYLRGDFSSNTIAPPTSFPIVSTRQLNTNNATDSVSSLPSSAPHVTPPSLWRPIPPPGYTCLGHVWTIDNTEPPTDLVRCIQTMYVEGVKDPKYQWDSQSNFDFDELTLWEATQTKTTISPGTFISRACEACDAPLEEFYALRKECIVGHGSVPFCAQPGTPWKVEVANQTKIDVPYAKLQPCGFQQEDKRIYGRQDNPDKEWENYAVELYNKSGFVGWKHLGASERLGKPFCLGSSAFGNSTFKNDLFMTDIPAEGRIIEESVKNITEGINGKSLSTKIAGDFVFLFPCSETNPVVEMKKKLSDAAAEASMDGSVESGLVNIDEDLGEAARHCNHADMTCKARSPWREPHICGEKEEPTESGQCRSVDNCFYQQCKGYNEAVCAKDDDCIGESRCHQDGDKKVCGGQLKITIKESSRTLQRAVPYGIGQDGVGKYVVLDQGASLLLVGNIWKAFSLGSEYTITEGTVLEFDFEHRNETEGHAICVDEDTNEDVEIDGQHRCFMLAGTEGEPSWFETWKIPREGDKRDSWRAPNSKFHYKIKLGSVSEGPSKGKSYLPHNTNMKYIALVQDNDADPEAGMSRFSNIKLYDEAVSAGAKGIATSICSQRQTINGFYKDNIETPTDFGATTQTIMRYNDGNPPYARSSLCPYFDAYAPTELNYKVQAYNIESTDFLDVQTKSATEHVVYWKLHDRGFRVLRVSDRELPPGYFRLGDGINTDFARSKAMAVAKGGGDSLAAPIAYIPYAECWAHGIFWCVVWFPICPNGYVALGNVWADWPHYRHPTQDYMRCVKEKLVVSLPWWYGLQWSHQWNGVLHYSEMTYNYWPDLVILPGTHTYGWHGNLYMLWKSCTQYGVWPYCSDKISMWPDDERDFVVPYAQLKPCDFHDEHKALYSDSLHAHNNWENTAVELYKDPITGFTGYKHLGASRRYGTPHCLGTDIFGLSNPLTLKYMPVQGNVNTHQAYNQMNGHYRYNWFPGADFVFLFECSKHDEIRNYKSVIAASARTSSTLRRDLVNSREDLGTAAKFPYLAWSNPHFCGCGEEPIKTGTGCQQMDTCYYKPSVCPDEVNHATCAADYSACKCKKGYVGSKYGANAVSSGSGNTCILAEDADSQNEVSFDSFDVVIKKRGLSRVNVKMLRYDTDDPDKAPEVVKKWDSTVQNVVALDPAKDIYKTTFSGLRPGTKYQYTIRDFSNTSDVFFENAHQVTYCCCDCEVSTQHDDTTGRPIDIRIHQVLGVVTFEFVDNSRCSEAYAFTRTEVGAGEFVKADASLKQTFTPNFATFAKEKCTKSPVKPGTNAADDLKFSRLQVSEPYRYCIRAVAERYAADSPHSSDDACKIHFVRWQASIKGRIVTDQGKVPVEDVKISWQLMNMEQTVVLHEGTATTKKPGKFKMEFDVDDSINKFLNRENAFPIRITFDKKTELAGSDPIVHEFVCEDGTVDCSGEDGVVVDLKHLEFDEPFEARDKTSVPIKGRVSIMEYGGCPLIGADVCVAQKRPNFPDVQGACVKTDGAGNFNLPATIGTTVGVKVAYFEHMIVRAPDNVLDYEKGMFIDPKRRYVGNDFVDIQKAPLFVEIAGGECELRLGRSKIEVDVCDSQPPIVLLQGQWKQQHSLPAHVLDVRVLEIRDDRNKEKPPQKLHDITKHFLDKTQTKAVDLREEVAKELEEKDKKAAPKDESAVGEAEPDAPKKLVPELRFQYDGTLESAFTFGGVDLRNPKQCPADNVWPEALVKKQAGTTYSLHITPTGSYFRPVVTLRYKLMTDMYCDVVGDDIEVEFENTVGIDAKWADYKKSLKEDEIKQYEICGPQNTCKYKVDHTNTNEVKSNARVTPKDSKGNKIKFVVGRPRVDSPYRKTFKVKVTKQGVRILTHVAEMVVTGDYKLGEGKSFALPTYEPILILRDPPGGLSQASYENVQTTMRVKSAEFERLEDLSHNSRLHIGADIDAESCAGFGIEICLKTFSLSGDGIGGGLDSDDVTYQMHREDVFTAEYTTTWSYATSDDPMLAGRKSDVFVVPNLNVLFSETLNFQWHSESCSTNVTTSTKFNLEDKKNKPAVSFFSVYYLETHVLPTLETKALEYLYRWGNETDSQNKTKLKSQYDTLDYALKSWNSSMIAYDATNNMAENQLIPAREWFDKWAAKKDKIFDVDPPPMTGNFFVDFANMAEYSHLNAMKPAIAPGAHWAKLTPETLTERATAVKNAPYVKPGSQSGKKDLTETNRLQFSGGGGTMEFTMGHAGITELSQLSTGEDNEESTFGGTLSFDMSGGPGIMIGGGFELTHVTTRSQVFMDTDGEERETTVSFVLGDLDKDDDFVLDIFIDPKFGTFIFRTVAGTTSAPWEGPPTARGEVIDLRVVQRPNKPVLPDEPMIFTLTIANNVNDRTSAFVVFLDHTTNPDGLTHKLGGNDLAVAHDFGPFNGVRVVTIEIWRPSRGYQFTPTLIQMQADWDGIGSEAKTVLLHNDVCGNGNPCIKFAEPCPVMEWAGALEREKKVVVNIANQRDPIPLIIRNPKKVEGDLASLVKETRLQEVIPYVRKLGEGEYDYGPAYLDVSKQQIANFTAIPAAAGQEDDYGYATINWNFQNVHIPDTDSDGRYEVVVETRCQDFPKAPDGFKKTTTEPVLIVVDRTAPKVYGMLPVRDVVVPGEEVSIIFTEPIVCELPLRFDLVVQVAGIKDGTGTQDAKYTKFSNDLNIDCKERKLGFLFDELMGYNVLMGREMRVSVTGVQDLQGNNITAAIEFKKTFANLDVNKTGSAFDMTLGSGPCNSTTINHADAKVKITQLLNLADPTRLEILDVRCESANQTMVRVKMAPATPNFGRQLGERTDSEVVSYDHTPLGAFYALAQLSREANLALDGRRLASFNDSVPELLVDFSGNSIDYEFSVSDLELILHESDVQRYSLDAPPSIEEELIMAVREGIDDHSLKQREQALQQREHIIRLENGMKEQLAATAAQTEIQITNLHHKLDEILDHVFDQGVGERLPIRERRNGNHNKVTISSQGGEKQDESNLVAQIRLLQLLFGCSLVAIFVLQYKKNQLIADRQ
ncbi:Cupin superfamily protein [Seminavis robusta]|uniref:Cupin superfamily protein n=1 Tax=Seminavis robusta TaxID=568900 RepID=A0A9N8E119_9STRA|nr:Cupin superfamily protein [Seminavis robusta]|eukprot:Sro401_g135330.1 Cupin superfamily protein (7033) ;mRNA; r:29300-54865